MDDLIIDTPVISVLMPVYNAEKFVRAAIESILAQTFRNFEFIIINDGSTDHSLDIIKRFDDKRIRVIDQQNKGLPSALNTGANFCTGEFIARMDADDISLPGRLEEQLEFLRKNPGIAVLSTPAIYIDENDTVCGRTFSITDPVAIKKMLFNSGCVIFHPAVMMRKKDFDAVGRYFEPMGGRFTDYHLWMKFLNKGYQIANSYKALIKYRLVKTAISSSYTLTEEGTKILLKTVKEPNPSMEEIKALEAACIPQSGIVSERKAKIDSFQNSFFTAFAFMGRNRVSQLISGLKNLYVRLYR